MGRVNCNHTKRPMTLTSDNIKWLSLNYNIIKFGQKGVSITRPMGTDLEASLT